MPPADSDLPGYHLIELELWLIRAFQVSNQRKLSGKAVVIILTPLSECMQAVWALSYLMSAWWPFTHVLDPVLLLHAM